MAIQWTQQSLTLSDVKTIVVTPVARDEETGEYVRELRIFGGDDLPQSPMVGEPAQQQTLIVTLRLKSRDRERIHIAVPSLEF